MKQRVLTAFAIFGISAGAATYGAKHLYDNRLDSADFEINHVAGSEQGGQVLNLVVLGDSTVEGTGASSQYTSLPGQIAKKTSALIERPVHVRAFGSSGAKTQDVIDDQIPHLEGLKVDVIVIEIGSNDVTHFTRMDQIQALTIEMIQKAKQAAPGAKVILGSAGTLDSPIFGPLRSFMKNRATKVRNTQERAASRAEALFMDFSHEVGKEYNETPGTSASDHFHPSDVGYEIWARPLARLVAIAAIS